MTVPTAAGGPSIASGGTVARTGTTVTVEVTFTAHPEASLPASPHGAESGPARFSLVNNNGRWTANVHVHEGLRPEAFPFVVGHELDEIADIVHRLTPTATAAEISEQMTARVFRPGSVGTVGTPLTAHDEAALAELRAHLEDMSRPGLNITQRRARQLRLDRLLESMGLTDATDISTRIAALRDGLPAALTGPGGQLDLQILEQTSVARRELTSMLAATPLSSEAAAARSAGATIIDEEFVRKTMYPQARAVEEFRQYGVRGGHVDGLLRDFERANPEYAFLETTPSPIQPGRSGFHRYEQYVWDPVASGTATPPPIGSPLRPGGASFNPSHWVRSNQLKTTANDLQRFLLEMEDAFARWRGANPGLATAPPGPPAPGSTAPGPPQDQWGRGLTPTGATGSRPRAVSSGGVEFSGYFTYTPGTTSSPATWRIRSGFVDASWF